MAGKLPSPRVVEGNESRGHDDDGERNVGEQHAVVKGAQPTWPVKGGHLRSAVMIDEVADEESTGKKEGTQHEIFVQASLLTSDGNASEQQKKQGGGVEQGIESGEVHGQYGYSTVPSTSVNLADAECCLVVVGSRAGRLMHRICCGWAVEFFQTRGVCAGQLMA